MSKIELRGSRGGQNWENAKFRQKRTKNPNFNFFRKI